MTPADEIRELELFTRYWDDALTPSQQAVLEALLRDDGSARERFRLFSLTAVQAADAGLAWQAKPDLPSRRKWLVRTGACLAAAGGVFALGRTALTQGSVRLSAVKGRVVSGGALAEVGTLLRAGQTILTQGVGATAMMIFPDGSRVTLTGESLATVDGANRLTVNSGTAAADFTPTQSADALTVATSSANVTAPGGATLAVHAAEAHTEVGVQDGSAAVANPAGVKLDEVRAGELLTVGRTGERRKSAAPQPPDYYAWDLSKPLTSGWKVAELDSDGPVPLMRPVNWFDPYHQAMLFQIRSDSNWTRGHALVHPDSIIRLRYAVEREGHAQVVVVVRGSRTSKGVSGCLEINTVFRPAVDGGWSVAEAPASEMLKSSEAPGFEAPWVAFLSIVNTYAEDLNLRVASFEILRPGR
jgi:hypothetical protein